MIRTLALLTLFTLLPLTAFAADNATKPPVVVMETSMGKLKIELYPEKAPKTVANFRQYVKDGFYNGLLIHRVAPGIIIQGGGFEPGMKERTTRPPIANEAANGLKNERGTISMARTQMVDSATSQFFVNLRDNAGLDHRGSAPPLFGYAVFGKVVEGMEVADKIAAVPTTTKGFHQDVPQEDVVIVKAYEER